MKTITLPYGRAKATFRIPTGIKFKILKIKSRPAVRNFKSLLNKSLDKPIGKPPFNRLFTPTDRVVIIIPDKTRRGYFPPILEVLLKRLTALGIPLRQLTILIARGNHPAHTPAELKELVGERIYQTIKIVDHDSRDATRSTCLGTTSFGTRVDINRAAWEADKIITCGVIQYHYFAGFSGGRKMIVPGISSYRTTLQNHRLVLNRAPNTGKHPGAALGHLEDNPVHQDLLEAVGIIERSGKTIFSIDLVLNHRRQVSKIFCGDIRKEHQAGCNLVRRTYSVRLAEPADCIIASTGGYPSDINYIQSHKTLEHAAQRLKPGGVLVALAECAQGLGSDDIMNWFKYGTPEALEKALRKEFVVHGHTALCSLLKAQRFKIHLYSQLPPEVVRQMHLQPVTDVQQTLDEIFKSLPPASTVLIIPEGFNLVPDVTP